MENWIEKKTAFKISTYLIPLISTGAYLTTRLPLLEDGWRL